MLVSRFPELFYGFIRGHFQSVVQNCLTLNEFNRYGQNIQTKFVVGKKNITQISTNWNFKLASNVLIDNRIDGFYYPSFSQVCNCKVPGYFGQNVAVIK